MKKSYIFGILLSISSLIFSGCSSSNDDNDNSGSGSGNANNQYIPIRTNPSSISDDTTSIDSPKSSVSSEGESGIGSSMRTSGISEGASS